MPDTLLRSIAYITVFITGAAGLIYQVTWYRYLSRLIGSDAIATAIILGVFLGGLSVGYLIVGKLTMRIRRYFEAYAVLEGIIGVWCLSFPFIFKGVEAISRSWSFSPPALILIQGVSSAILLMGIPTICMGGTIPLLTRGMSATVTESTRVHARIYGINTAGAFIGTLAAGFALIPIFGLPGTMIGTSTLNFAAAIIFLILPQLMKTVPQAQPSTPGTDVQSTVSAGKTGRLRYAPAVLYSIAFLSGFYVMTLENVLIRMTSLSLGSSTYSFSIIVSVFILAIAIGSFVVSALNRLPRQLLFFNQLGILLFLVIIYFTLDAWPYAHHLIRISFQSNMAGLWAYHAAVFFSLAFLLVLPVGLMGATVPLIFHELKQDLNRVGHHSGMLLSWNTAGNLVGSLSAGIILYVILDNAGVFAVAVFLAAAAVLVAGAGLSRRYAAAGIAAMVVVILLSSIHSGFDSSRFVVGTFRIRSPLPYSFEGPEGFHSRLNAGFDLEFYEDGPVATVAVTKDKSVLGPFQEPSMALMINGKSDSSTLGDIYTLRLLAHIPALLAEQRQNVMVVGLGTGVTAGELLLYPDIKQIDVAEISPAVVNALPFFKPFIHGLSEDPRVNIQLGDAFRIIGRSQKKWDIIISEPSNPWVTGVDALFSRDFYRLVNKHLTESGLLMQWIHTTGASTAMIDMTLNTLRQEFPESRVFIAGADLLILASKRPVSCQDLASAERTLASTSGVRASLADLRITSLAGILVRERWTPSFLADYVRGGGIQTLDFPRLHYLAGKDFFIGRDLSPSIFLDNRTTAYGNDYLFYKQCAEWQIASDSRDAFQTLVGATISVFTNAPSPMTDALLLRAYLSDSQAYPLPPEKEKQYGIDVLPFIIDDTADEEEWAYINLRGAPMRVRAEVLLRHVKNFRNWMTPYPMDGLVALLRKGMAESPDPGDRNWFTLQLARLLKQERVDSQTIDEILQHLVRDKNGNLLISKEDFSLYLNLVEPMN